MLFILFGFVWVLLNFVIIKKFYVFWLLIIVFGFGLLMDLWFKYVLVYYSVVGYDMWFNVSMVFVGLILLGFSLFIIIINKIMLFVLLEVFLVYLKNYIKKIWVVKVVIEVVMILIVIILVFIVNNFI